MPKTKPASAAKAVNKVSKTKTEPKKRQMQLPKRTLANPRTWWQQRAPINNRPLPKARVILVAALRQIWSAKQVFIGIVLIYSLLNLVLAQSLQNSDNLAAFRQALEGAFSGFGGKLVSGTTSFVYLLTNINASATAVTGLYQTILFVICSLAVIWALRQVSAGHTIRVRDGFYKGMYPLVPFMLMFFLLGLQLLPLVVGMSLYSYGISGKIAVGLWEHALFIVIAAVLVFWSLRMITATIFAFYAVTLPEMAPLQAYRSARELVNGRRLVIWRKLIFLPVVLLLCAGVIIAPLIFVSPGLAVWLFFLFSSVTLPITHAYLYKLYRDLL